MTPESDLIVVGAGPAGTAAALMAVSLGMRVRLIEHDRVGGKLHHIGALNNVPGNWATGPDLAAALAADLERLAPTNLLRRTTGTATAVSADDEQAYVDLADGSRHSGGAAVIATGVTTLSPADATWVTAPDGLWPTPLWRTGPAEMSGPTWVLGADRPLGTWLRAHPTVERTLNVLCPPDDDYKAAEVAEDPRVHLVRCTSVSITPATRRGWALSVNDRGGEERQYIAGALLGNLGNQPAALAGLAQSTDGYCPPDEQHPRIWTAGDLRSARFQRIVAAQGSGAEAVLARYYSTALVSADAQGKSGSATW
ncbi:FAD-dependent oxidoreductase [Streptomyces atriruber]|uniref:FAD-dependent oxidoreductase n=1 Tax=Streptomyces atriruber TaxID=545121 RepID=UPI0006E43799|nr:FAD-dependent oxidoreductase [Streptomyces atriruber]